MSILAFYEVVKKIKVEKSKFWTPNIFFLPFLDALGYKLSKNIGVIPKQFAGYKCGIIQFEGLMYIILFENL